jgi:hypothetical protein
LHRQLAESLFAFGDGGQRRTHFLAHSNVPVARPRRWNLTRCMRFSPRMLP